MTEKYG